MIRAGRTESTALLLRFWCFCLRTNRPTQRTHLPNSSGHALLSWSASRLVVKEFSLHDFQFAATSALPVASSLFSTESPNLYFVRKWPIKAFATATVQHAKNGVNIGSASASIARRDNEPHEVSAAYRPKSTRQKILSLVAVGVGSINPESQMS